MRLRELLEARRNPTVNFDGRLNDRLSSAKGFLSQFLPAEGDDPSYFVTFTQIAKVGINPQSEYQTPIGIYAYPIINQTARLHGENDLPFAGDAKYISVLHSNVPYSRTLWFDEHDSYKNYERDYGKLLQFLEEGYPDQDTKGFLETAGRKAFEPRDPQSRIWNQMRWVATAEAVMRSDGKPYNKTLDGVAVHLKGATKDIAIKGVPINWNYLLRKVLGYDAVIDMDTGTIHSNEPLQALFLSKEAVSVVDQRINQNARDRGPQHMTWLEFAHMVIDGNITISTFFYCIESVLQHGQRADFTFSHRHYYIDKPVGAELDVAMREFVRNTHVGAAQRDYFMGGVFRVMALPRFRVSEATGQEIIEKVIRVAVEATRGNDLMALQVADNVANRLLKHWPKEAVQASLRRLGLDQTASLL